MTSESSTVDPAKNRARRVEIPLLVQYWLSPTEPPRIDYALNVSSSGLFIATDDDLEVGMEVHVQLTTRDGAHLLEGSGVVARAANGGCAIALTGFGDEAEEILGELVAKALAARR